MQPARMTVAHRPPQNRGAGQVHLARLQNDYLVERLMAVTVVLPHKDAQQHRLFWHLHRDTSQRFRGMGAIGQSHTAIRHRKTEATIFADARSQSPSRARFSVCRLNDENVVKPPQTPIITNCRAGVPTSKRPSGSVNVKKKPMIHEPTTLTTSVPHGKISPIRSAISPEHRNRSTPPSALPTAIQK